MEHKITKRQLNAKNCFVCGVGNPRGLRSVFYETDTNELVSVTDLPPEFQGYPGRVHGGIAATILDETIGRAICIGKEDMVWGVTLDLNVKYRKPVPFGAPIKVIARVTRDRGRLFEGSGEIVLESGEVAIEARGLYMKQDIGKLAGEGFADREWGFEPDGTTPETVEA